MRINGLPTFSDGLALTFLGSLRAILKPIGPHLRPSWGHLGTILGHLGAILGRFWGHFGPSWGDLGAILGPFWGHVWGHVGVQMSTINRITSHHMMMIIMITIMKTTQPNPTQTNKTQPNPTNTTNQQAKPPTQTTTKQTNKPTNQILKSNHHDQWGILISAGSWGHLGPKMAPRAEEVAKT